MHKDRKVELLSDDHLTVRGSSHARIHEKWLVRAGREIHGASGRKTVIEAGTELTLKAGGAFIRLDPSGAYINGVKIKINSGGSPGSGSGAKPLLPHGSESEETESLQREGMSQRMGSVGEILPIFRKPVPATVTSEEEICRTVMAVKRSDVVQKGLARAIELTRKNGVEYSGWILENAPGEYSVSALKKGEAMSVTPDAKPENAIGNFHTHAYSAFADPSEKDRIFASMSEDKSIFYMTISTNKNEFYIDGNGDDVFCE